MLLVPTKMEKKYYFKLKLQGTVKEPILNIKPVTYAKKPIPYPISFSELNVPIIVNNRNYPGDSFDLEYLLDFESGSDEEGERHNALNRKNLMYVLSDLNKIIDENLRKALCFESKLKSRYKVILDNCLGPYKRRLGNPRISKKSNSPRKLKGRLD